MPSLTAGRLDRCFRSKLKARVVEGGRDRCYEVFGPGDQLVGRTWLSRGWKGSEGIDASMLARIKRELKLRTIQELVDLANCPMTRDKYLDIVNST